MTHKKYHMEEQGSHADCQPRLYGIFIKNRNNNYIFRKCIDLEFTIRYIILVVNNLKRILMNGVSFYQKKSITNYHN